MLRHRSTRHLYLLVNSPIILNLSIIIMFYNFLKSQLIDIVIDFIFYIKYSIIQYLKQ